MKTTFHLTDAWTNMWIFTTHEQNEFNLQHFLEYLNLVIETNTIGVINLSK